MFQSEVLQKCLTIVETNVAKMSEDQKARLEKNVRMTFTELADAQEVQSRAFASGAIGLDFAQDIYNAIGPTCGRYDTLTLPERVVVLEALAGIARAAIKVRT